MTSMNERPAAKVARRCRCAVYTRKSTEDGLEREFNSLDAQREAGEAFIKSQAHEGWECVPNRYDDGGFTGGNMDRPALRRMLTDIEAGRVDCVIVYKVDRLSRSLLDFARMMETFEKHSVSFVSVTQQLNTATSMGRLILNVLLSFAQFEREIISERTRDKIAATRRKGKWSGGMPLLGYDVVDTKLVVNADEADQVRAIFNLYLEHEGLVRVVQELERRGWRNKRWITRKGTPRGGRPFNKNILWHLLTNVTYLGKVKYKGEVHVGEHEAVVGDELWQRVQAKLQRNGRTGGAAVRNKYGAILKGLIHCTACGCAMTPTHTTKNGTLRYRYYVCTAAQKRGWHTCPSPSIPAGEIEQFVVEHIECIGRDPQLIAETVRQTHAQATHKADELAAEERRLKRELDSYGRELQKLVRRPGIGHRDEQEMVMLVDVHERIAHRERRLAEICEESQRLVQNQINGHDIVRALAEFQPVWESLSPREQGRLLQLLIERIEYDGRDGTISITFHASGIATLANHERGEAAA